MANVKDEQVEEKQMETSEEEEQSPKPQKISFLKVGLPVLLLQIIATYFLANNVIVPRLYGDLNAVSKQNSELEADMKEKAEEAGFGKIFTVEDVIVNPAESRGMQFVLINFGFEVKDDSDLDLLKSREIQVRDILIKTLSAKTLAQLDGPDDKELLRQEIKKNMGSILPDGHLMNVYFSNYIIQ